MTLLVPFDGSPLSVAALERATELADARAAELVVLTVVPSHAVYARERGWLDPGDPFDDDLVGRKLRQRVRDVAREATFRTEHVEHDDPAATVELDVARTIRRVAAEVGADVAVVGRENAGRVARPLASVGSPVSEDPSYDVYIVRHAD